MTAVTDFININGMTVFVWVKSHGRYPNNHLYFGLSEKGKIWFDSLKTLKQFLTN